MEIFLHVKFDGFGAIFKPVFLAGNLSESEEAEGGWPVAPASEPGIGEGRRNDTMDYRSLISECYHKSSIHHYKCYRKSRY